MVKFLVLMLCSVAFGHNVTFDNDRAPWLSPDYIIINDTVKVGLTSPYKHYYNFRFNDLIWSGVDLPVAVPFTPDVYNVYSDDVYVRSFTVVPEPSTLILLLIGVGYACKNKGVLLPQLWH